MSTRYDISTYSGEINMKYNIGDLFVYDQYKTADEKDVGIIIKRDSFGGLIIEWCGYRKIVSYSEYQINHFVREQIFQHFPVK
jgi:hypothetical protein